MNILFVLFMYTAIGYFKNSLVSNNQHNINNIFTYKRIISYYLKYLCIKVAENLLPEINI